MDVPQAIKDGSDLIVQLLGWRGVLIVLGLIAMYVLARMLGSVAGEPPPPPRMPDVADDPTRPDAKWDDNVGPGIDPQDHPPG